MDPVTSILAALTAGVASGAGETASSAVKDGYRALRALLTKRFAGDSKAQETLADHEGDPDTYERPLAKHLRESGAYQDPEIMAAVEAVLRAAHEAGVTTKYNVTVTGGKVGIIGDHGNVTIY